MNEFAKKNFNLILLLATVAGFLLPQPGEFSGPLILAVLCFIIFASSFKVDFSPAFFKAHIFTILGFYLLRFLLLPSLLYGLVYFISPFYAGALFLLVVLPCGVTSPAFSNVFGGNVSLALALLILSSSLTPFALPFLGGLLMSEQVEVDRLRLFTTLFITVIFPYLAHLPFRKSRSISRWMRNHDSFISIVGIALIFALAIAEYRPVLLEDTRQLLPHFLVSITAFLLLYLFGWYAWLGAKRMDKIALLFSSGANNVALGVVISFLYFPTQMGVFFVVSEIVWVLVLIPVRRLAIRFVHG
ncbi:MAG: bile acid:sodium symporter family protein [Cyclobacteriaceae bacterium]